jgi:hypothetical protein
MVFFLQLNQYLHTYVCIYLFKMFISITEKKEYAFTHSQSVINVILSNQYAHYIIYGCQSLLCFLHVLKIEKRLHIKAEYVKSGPRNYSRNINEDGDW